MKIYSTNNSCATGTLDLIPTVYKPTHTTHCAAALRFDLASYWCWVSWFPLPWELVFKTTAQISVSSSTFSLLSLSFPPPWAFLDVWFHSRPLEVADFVSLLPIFTCIMVFQWVVFFGGGGGCFFFSFDIRETQVLQLIADIYFLIQKAMWNNHFHSFLFILATFLFYFIYAFIYLI